MQDELFHYDPADFPDPHRCEEFDPSLLEANLKLTPLQRLQKLDDVLDSLRVLREASIRHYGRDPRLPEGTE